MATKIYAQVSIKQNQKLNKNKNTKSENNLGNESLPTKSQLKKAQKVLLEAGCEITSLGPTIGISMDVEAFNKMFGICFNENILDPNVRNEIIIPQKLKDIVKDVAVVTLPDYY